MKHYIRSIYIILLIMFLVIQGITQEQPNFTQHVENQFVFNPAYAGVKGITSFSVLAREQWVGIEHSPKTHTFCAQTRLLKSGKKINNPMSWISNNAKRTIMLVPKSKGRVGFGGYVFNDQSGLISRTGINLAYAYHITLPTVQYSFGLALTGYQLRLNTGEAYTGGDEQDPMLYNDKNHVFIPDASVGFYLLKRNFYLGISANKLMNSALRIGNASNVDYRYQRHYNLNGGYQLYTEEWIFQPSLLIKFSEKVILQNDVVITAHYIEKYFIGLGYRMNLYNPYTNDAYDELSISSNGDVLILVGFQINNFFIGYSFDYPISAVAKGSYGTHEISASIRLGSSDRRFKWKDRY